MDFYYMPGSGPCRSVLLLAKQLGIDFNRKLINVMAGEQNTPEYLKLNPQHTIPTLVDNGFSICESRAILVYLAQKYDKDDSLYPKDLKKQAVVNQSLFFDLGTLFKSFLEYYTPLFMGKSVDPEKAKVVETAFGFLNTFLEGSEYVAGDLLTVADLSILSSVTTFDVLGFDFSQFANVTRWYEKCKKLPGWEENWEGALSLKKIFG